MTDPFSIIGLVGSSLGGIIKAKEWLDGIRRAPQSIQALSVELRAIESLLRELGTVLNSFNSATRDQAGRLVRDAVRNCEAILRQIDVLLRPFVTADSDSSISTWKRFAFNFRESDISQLRREMESCKQTLNMAINCANLLATQNVDRGVKRMQRHFGIASSSVAGSDIAGRQFERTEPWILEAEALVEDESENEIPESIQPAKTGSNTKKGLTRDKTAKLKLPSPGGEQDSTSKGKLNGRRRVVPNPEAIQKHSARSKQQEGNVTRPQLQPLRFEAKQKTPRLSQRLEQLDWNRKLLLLNHEAIERDRGQSKQPETNISGNMWERETVENWVNGWKPCKWLATD